MNKSYPQSKPIEYHMRSLLFLIFIVFAACKSGDRVAPDTRVRQQRELFDLVKEYDSAYDAAINEIKKKEVTEAYTGKIKSFLANPENKYLRNFKVDVKEVDVLDDRLITVYCTDSMQIDYNMLLTMKESAKSSGLYKYVSSLQMGRSHKLSFMPMGAFSLSNNYSPSLSFEVIVIPDSLIKAK